MVMIKLLSTGATRPAAPGGFACASMVLMSVLSIGTITAITRPAQAAGRRTAVAHSARVLNATDTAHLRYIRSSGSVLFEEGSASGTLPGKMLANFNIGPTVSASFTIYVHGGGTIKGHGTASPHGSGIYESFAGSLVATGGTGRYSHAHGHAGLYGVFDRRSYAITVQTTGRLAY